MIKVAMIGAGSVVFSRNLTGDILGFPEFKNATITYMDIDKDRLETAGLMGRKVAKAVGATPRIEVTQSRRKALEGADFVINMVQVGGFDSTLVDFEIPRQYGLNFTIADTTGPGGFFRALRTFPMLSGMCRDMEEVCPDAILLNYSNPMSMNMQTVFRTSGVRATGLCHSVQGTFDGLMRYIGEEPGACSFICAGINHMAFFLRLEKDGHDLYPRLFKAMQKPEVFESNRVRFELMRRLGYFVTESSEHNAEYCPWFIPRGKDLIKRYRIPIDEYLRRCDSNTKEFDRLKRFARTREPLKVRRSHEYGSLIIHSVATGTPRVIYGSLPNRGSITNLPATAIVEIPTLVDASGLQGTVVGELPPQLVGYMQPHVTQHELFIRAAVEGRRDYVYQAAMFDPLTAATLSLDRIVDMCDELIAGHGKLLPRLDKPVRVATSGKTFKAARPAALLAAWEKRKAADLEDYVMDWRVIGAFPAAKPGRNFLETKTQVETDLARAEGGRMDLKATYAVDGKTVSWQTAGADARGRLIFDRIFGVVEWASAYAYAEIITADPRDVLLSCGSDDGIKIWLNGKVVHALEENRSIKPDDDEVPVRLEAGINRLLVKIVNHRAGWGLCLAVRSL